jgi:uncharacterized tellurite resistance protein B-like protein
MLNHIKRFFEQHLAPECEEKEGGHRLNLACCALMIEVARMDQNVREEELAVVAEACRSLLDLSREEVAELMALAHDEAREATSLYQFTSLINSNYDEQQKYALLQLMWQVAFADGRIEAMEEHLIRRVADLLYVPHVRFVQARHVAEQTKKKF